MLRDSDAHQKKVDSAIRVLQTTTGAKVPWAMTLAGFSKSDTANEIVHQQVRRCLALKVCQDQLLLVAVMVPLVAVVMPPVTLLPLTVVVPLVIVPPVFVPPVALIVPPVAFIVSPVALLSLAVVVPPVVVPPVAVPLLAVVMPPTVAPPVAVSCRVVIVPPVAIVVPPVAMLPLSIDIPPVVVPPVAVIVPPVTKRDKLIVESAALASNGDPLIFDAPNELIADAADIENNSGDSSSDTSGVGGGFMGGEEGV